MDFDPFKVEGAILPFCGNLKAHFPTYVQQDKNFNRLLNSLLSTMVSPTRTEFLRSRFYRCALTFNKRNEQRLKNIRDLLEKADEKEKRTRQTSSKKRFTSTWKIPDSDDRSTKNRHSKEDTVILSAIKDESGWVYDATNEEYVLTFGSLTVMKIPTDMFNRLKPFQRDAVKWVASVGPIGGILADDMGMVSTSRVHTKHLFNFISHALPSQGKTVRKSLHCQLLYVAIF